MGKTSRRSRMGKTSRRSRIGKTFRRSRLSKKLKRKSKKTKGGMMDHYGSIGVSKFTLEKDLNSAIKYKPRFYFSKAKFDKFIKDFADKEEDHSVSGYAYYGKKQMIQNAKKELNNLDAKLKKEAVVKKTFTKKNMPARALETLLKF